MDPVRNSLVKYLAIHTEGYMVGMGAKGSIVDGKVFETL